jgi:hypothetical protein
MVLQELNKAVGHFITRRGVEMFISKETSPVSAYIVEEKIDFILFVYGKFFAIIKFHCDSLQGQNCLLRV